MQQGSLQYYREVEVWRLKMGRWDQQNWADLCASGLRGPQDGSSAQPNLLPGLRTATAFKGELASIHRARDKCCRDHLQVHAFRGSRRWCSSR
mmetsp:Transcript_34308/g.94537  ORF Transcript_34308/g.94537 Transcript_34308/m.94537 type:complete len:93 (+) Transcript_34308:374-652(+)